MEHRDFRLWALVMSQKAWQGGERLWKVFWVYYLLVAVLIGFGSGLAVWLDFQFPGLASLAALFGVAVFIWVIWAYVSLWRCALNVQWLGWGYIVRAFVVAQVAWVCINIADTIVPIFLS